MGDERMMMIQERLNISCTVNLADARWLVQQLTAAQATIAQRDAQVAALEAERDRLRARTHELQEKHDAETRGMKKQVARYRDLFSRAGDALKQSRDGYVIPSAWDSAMFGVLTEQLAARDAQVAELTAALEHIDRTWSAFQDDPPTTRCVGGYPAMRVTIGIESWARLMTAIDTSRELLARTPAAPEGETVRADG